MKVYLRNVTIGNNTQNVIIDNDWEMKSKTYSDEKGHKMELHFLPVTAGTPGQQWKAGETAIALFVTPDRPLPRYVSRGLLVDGYVARQVDHTAYQYRIYALYAINRWPRKAELIFK